MRIKEAMSVSINTNPMGICLGDLLALLVQEVQKVFNRVFCGLKVGLEILKVMDGSRGLGSA